MHDRDNFAEKEYLQPFRYIFYSFVTQETSITCENLKFKFYGKKE